MIQIFASCLHLPTLVYHRLRGGMQEVYNMINGIFDTEVSSFLTKHADVVQNRSICGHSKNLFNKTLKARHHYILFWPPNCEPMECKPTRICGVSSDIKYLIIKLKIDQTNSGTESISNLNFGEATLKLIYQTETNDDKDPIMEM